MSKNQSVTLDDAFPDDSAVTQIAALGQLAHGAREINRRTGAVFLFNDGKQVEIDCQPSPRNHEADSVDAIACMTDAVSTVWHRGDLVVAVLNDADESLRDDRVTWKLTKTDSWAFVTGGVSGDQKSLVWLLQTKLRREAQQSASLEQLIAALRSLKFTRGEQSEGDLGRGRESMGRSVKAEVSGATDIPEWVTVRVRRWAELEYECEIELRVDVDLESEAIRVTPTRDEARRAELDMQGMLGGYLTDHVDCTVVAGAP